MPNFVALTVYSGDSATATTSVAFPSNGSGNILVEQVATPFNQVTGVSIVSKIIVPYQGLNNGAKVYNSTQTVAQIVTALGAGFVTLSVYRSANSNGAINIAFPANGATGTIIETVTNTTIGTTPILSVITLPAHGLKQKARTYLSASTVAALVTALG